MTEKEADIVSAYTGYLIGDFGEMHKYAESLFDRPIFTHEMGIKSFSNHLRELSKEDFVNITIIKE